MLSQGDLWLVAGVLLLVANVGDVLFSLLDGGLVFITSR